MYVREEHEGQNEAQATYLVTRDPNSNRDYNCPLSNNYMNHIKVVVFFRFVFSKNKYIYSVLFKSYWFPTPIRVPHCLVSS